MADIVAVVEIVLVGIVQEHIVHLVVVSDTVNIFGKQVLRNLGKAVLQEFGSIFGQQAI